MAKLQVSKTCAVISTTPSDRMQCALPKQLHGGSELLSALALLGYIFGVLGTVPSFDAAPAVHNYCKMHLIPGHGMERTSVLQVEDLGLKASPLILQMQLTEYGNHDVAAAVMDI